MPAKLYQHFNKVMNALRRKGSLTSFDVMTILGMADIKYVRGLMRAFEALSDEVLLVDDRLVLTDRTNRIEDYWMNGGSHVGGERERGRET